MRAFVLAAFCLAFAAMPSFAQESHDAPENWIIARAAGGVLGYDAESFKRGDKGDRVSGETILYFDTLKSAHGVAYRYQLRNLTFDCKGHRFRIDDAVALDDNAILLDVLGMPDSLWHKASGGADLQFYRVACEHAALKQSKSVGVLETMLQRARTLK